MKGPKKVLAIADFKRVWRIEEVWSDNKGEWIKKFYLLGWSVTFNTGTRVMLSEKYQTFSVRREGQKPVSGYTADDMERLFGEAFCVLLDTGLQLAMEME